MKVIFILLSIVCLLCTRVHAGSAEWPKGELIVPAVSKMSFNHYAIYFKPEQSIGSPLSFTETPASIACIYGLTPYVKGCPINGTTIVPNTGTKPIAIVVAFDYDLVENDLNVFSAQFGLPPCTTANGCFTKVFADGTKPGFDAGWAFEMSIDTQWVHAMAPNAPIILVEAHDDRGDGLPSAEDVATNLIAAAGGGMVTNSWGIPEFEGEQDFDSHLQQPGIVYFFATGDAAAPSGYPSTSPNVIAVGGTTIVRDKEGLFVREDGWSSEAFHGGFIGGNGGPSMFETRPDYQWSIQKITGNARGTPDVSAIANPHTPVSLYVSFLGGWTFAGGTSVATPIMAGIFNSAHPEFISTHDAHVLFYKGALKHQHEFWHDITIGNNGHLALPGYDFVTGIGSPRTYAGK